MWDAHEALRLRLFISKPPTANISTLLNSPSPASFALLQRSVAFVASRKAALSGSPP
jgi:hypothetical protein